MTTKKHTQGRLAATQDAYLVDENDDIIALATDGEERCRKIDTANAAELVRRWNAFEPGGIVEEMREALERLLLQLPVPSEAQPGDPSGMWDEHTALMLYPDPADADHAGMTLDAISSARALLARMND